MKREEEIRKVLDNPLLEYLKNHGVHPIEYIDNLFEQKSYLISTLFKLLDKEGKKKIREELKTIRRPIDDKLRPNK